MQYWQVAPGDGTIDMTDLFLMLGIALIGPGRFGDYFDNSIEYESLGREGQLVKTFASEVSVGDIFVLKRPLNPSNHTWHVSAVGEVISPYRFEPIFHKVDTVSWDVQHCRRVKWTKINETVQGGGAPIRIQRLLHDNPLRIVAEKVISGE